MPFRCPGQYLWKVNSIENLQARCHRGKFFDCHKSYSISVCMFMKQGAGIFSLVYLTGIEPGICRCAIFLPEGCVAVVLCKVGKNMVDGQ